MIKNYSTFINESKIDFNFKKLFLQLTEFTVPAGYEDSLEPILRKFVPNLKKDSIGNYYVEIGNSKTLFTSHLDTFSKNREKVNHIIDGNIIKTDGTTILGGDNKNGVVILLYLISKNIPGTYYFFIGEESIVNGVGCWGSTNALNKYKEHFKRFNKAIAFDRRGKGSFVKRQGGRNCASDEFANSVISSFAKYGLEFKMDNAYRTDSAIFMDIIPEITNLSSGGEYEHTYMETSDIDYIEKIAIASSKINWENLPIVRTPQGLPLNLIDRVENNNDIIEKSKLTFNKVLKLLGTNGYVCINIKDFQPGIIMYFDKYLSISPIELVINGDYIKCVNGEKKLNNFKEGNFDDFKKYIKIDIKKMYRNIWLEIVKKMDNNSRLFNGDLIKILDDFDITYNEFKNYMIESKEKDFINFSDNFIILDIRILHNSLKNKQLEQEKNISNN